MTNSKMLVFSITFTLLMFGRNSLCLEPSFIEYYNRGELNKARDSAYLAIKNNPKDGLPYYYLGHIKIKLNDIEGARMAYFKGLNNCTDRNISNKLVHALEALEKSTLNYSHSPPVPSPPSRNYIPERYTSNKNQPNAAFPGEDPEQFENRLDQRMKEKQEAIVKNLDMRIASEERKLNERIAVLRREEDDEVHTVPYIFVGGSDYKDRVRMVRDRYQKKIDKLNTDFKEWVKRAEKEAEAKIELQTHSRFSLSNHYRNSAGTSRLTPNGSCTHVRNYINFNGYQQPAGKMTTEKMGSLKDSIKKPKGVSSMQKKIQIKFPRNDEI